MIVAIPVVLILAAVFFGPPGITLWLAVAATVWHLVGVFRGTAVGLTGSATLITACALWLGWAIS